MNAIKLTRSTRRDFVKGSVMAGAGLSLAATAAHDSLAADDAGWIDAHVHVWTPDTQKYPLAAGFTKESMKPASFTPEQLFAHCRPVGVKRIVLIQMSFYGFDNSYMLDMMKEHAGVFSGVAVIDENAEPAKKMAELKAKGVRGFRIRPRSLDDADWLDRPGMQNMWRAGAEQSLAMCCLIDAKFLPAVDRLCSKYPYTPVVIDHFARIGVDGTIRDSDVDNLCKLARHRKVTVKTSAFYALGKKKAPYQDLGPMIRRLLDAFGPDRLMWASDCPFQVDPGHEYKPSIDLIQSGLDFLSTSDKEWLLRKTAERVFFQA